MSMNNAVFLKNLENVRKHRIIKLVITERRRIYLVSERKYHSTKFFTENVLAIKMKKKNNRNTHDYTRLFRTLIIRTRSSIYV